MPKLILCEGRTDAILLSYYLKRTSGWSYKKEKVPLWGKFSENEEINWYYKETEQLYIFAVGGIDNIRLRLQDIISRNIEEPRRENLFDKIALVVDHDTRSLQENIEKITGYLIEAGIVIKNEEFRLDNWCTTFYNNQQNESMPLSILAMVLPQNSNGNLETFLLNAIKNQGNDDRIIVEQSQEYINSLGQVTYIQKHRYKGKAQLGAVLSVFSPEWVFTELDKRLIVVDWTQYDEINEAFKVLKLI